MSATTNVQQKIDRKLWKQFQAALIKNDGAVSIKDGLTDAIRLYIEQDEKEQRERKG